MSVDPAISRFRRRITARYRSRCRIERPSKTSSFNEETGRDEPDAPTLIYEGPCNLRPLMGDRVGIDAQAGEREIRTVRSRGSLPVNTPVKKNDIWTVTRSTYDAGLVGQKYRISDVPNDDWQMARVVILEKVT